MKKSKYYYLVNTLTALRVIGIPFIFMIKDPIAQVLFADFLFITDFLDGYLARKYKVSSGLGAVLDLLADKLLVLSVLIYAAILGNVWWVLVALIAFREVYSMVLRFNHYRKEKKLISASLVGKTKTTFQFIALNFVLLDLPGKNILLIIVVCLSYYSFLGYFKTSRGKDDK